MSKQGARESVGAGGCGHTSLAAAYIDRELDGVAAADFEEHSQGCPACWAALLEQRRLHCILDATFDPTFEKGFALPRGFERAVRARAQTDMRGVRDARERVRAVKICAALSAVSLALLGAAAFVPLLDAARSAASLLSAAGRTASGAGAGAGLALRAVGGGFGAGSAAVAVLLLLCAAGAFVLLLRLIGSYHRARAND